MEILTVWNPYWNIFEKYTNSYLHSLSSQNLLRRVKAILPKLRSQFGNRTSKARLIRILNYAHLGYSGENSPSEIGVQTSMVSDIRSPIHDTLLTQVKTIKVMYTPSFIVYYAYAVVERMGKIALFFIGASIQPFRSQIMRRILPQWSEMFHKIKMGEWNNLGYDDTIQLCIPIPSADNYCIINILREQLSTFSEQFDPFAPVVKDWSGIFGRVEMMISIAMYGFRPSHCIVCFESFVNYWESPCSRINGNSHPGLFLCHRCRESLIRCPICRNEYDNQEISEHIYRYRIDDDD